MQRKPGRRGNQVLHISMDRIVRNPKYKRLVRNRAILGGSLSVLTLIIYLGFIGLIAYKPDFLATPIGDNVTTVGILVGLFVILSAFVLVAIYVMRANTAYDRLNREIIKEAAE